MGAQGGDWAPSAAALSALTLLLDACLGDHHMPSLEDVAQGLKSGKSRHCTRLCMLHVLSCSAVHALYYCHSIPLVLLLVHALSMLDPRSVPTERHFETRSC